MDAVAILKIKFLGRSNRPPTAGAQMAWYLRAVRAVPANLELTPG
jgi:hypothetical protein